MLDVIDLVTAYGKIEALKGVSLHAETGKITCLLGPNGAGKTTTVEMCEGGSQAASWSDCRRPGSSRRVSRSCRRTGSCSRI